ncbi:colicin E5-related ribonuclease [Microvirga sp. 2TAF3]|uniref:colicin E5-related ribonuclease n=1 Tax=Microvirga sp. 2TAF3 TaxID=3233014 RepID=UPI003F9AC992
MQSTTDVTRAYEEGALGGINPAAGANGSQGSLGGSFANVITSYACFGCVGVFGGSIGGYMVGNNIKNGYYGNRVAPGLTSDPILNEEATNENKPNSGIKIDDKIAGQLTERGWTKAGVEELVNGLPAGTSTDSRGPKKTPDGLGRNDPATVYGSPSGGYVVVNDRTKEVVQVSDKNGPWAPDDRIKWNN